MIQFRLGLVLMVTALLGMAGAGQAAGVEQQIANSSRSNGYVDPAFLDHAFLNPSRYGCRMDREILVISGDVHRELDRLLAGRPNALSANEVVVFYERRMAKPIGGNAYAAHTRLFLDVLAACDIYLAF